MSNTSNVEHNPYLEASESRNPLSILYNDVYYLGRQSIEPFKYSKFTFLGFKETNDQQIPAIPVIGIDENNPVAAIVDDSVIRKMKVALMKDALPKEDEYTISMAPVAFILAVVAIDATLQAAMWAVAVSAALAKDQ